MRPFVSLVQAVMAGTVNVRSQDVATLVEQVPAEGFVELRMGLDAEHLVCDREGCHRAKGATGHEGGTGRQRKYLVLVAGQ